MNLTELPDLPAAACRNTPNPEVFFPTSVGHPARIHDILLADVKEMCGHCPERLRCLEWAIAHDEMGVWGGTTDEERRLMQKKPPTQEQRRRHVRRLHREGLNDGQIAEQLGVSRSVINSDRKSLKLAENYYNGPAIDDRRVLVAVWHARGFNDREIAAKLNISRELVCRDRATLGLPTNHRNRADGAA